MTDENKVEETVTAEQPQEEANYDLTVQDLNNLRAIIDVAAQRGAFKPNEMTAVGNVYNKLNNFLSNVSKGQKENA